MKNIQFKSINVKLQYLIVLIGFLTVTTIRTNAQVAVPFKQRTSEFSTGKTIYNVRGDFTMLGNTNLTLPIYSNTQNNNGQNIQYVDIDNDPNTWNSSSSTLAFSTENGAVPSCSNIVYAGLYWTGKSSPNNTFTATKQIPNGTQSTNTNLTIEHDDNITNTNYALSVTRNNPSSSNRNPIYTFTGNDNTYVFNFYNSNATNRVTVRVNSGAETNVPVTINGSNTEATLITPLSITDGTVNIKINKLIRSAATNLSTSDTQNTSSALVNVSGTVPAFTTLTKNYDKRVISLKGPNSSSYTQFTANASDIYYPTGATNDAIFSAYKEITTYVKQNGIGEYFVADIALLEGNPGGTGYSGGWGIIVVYENAKMKYRDVTIFDGYAYVKAGNSSGFDLDVAGFNTVQTGNVGVKLGLMASEGDVSFTGDYFQIQKKSDASFLSLNHSENFDTNFFNSSINTGGAFRNPNIQNNTGIDIIMFSVPNSGNTVIGNNQTSTKFKYGTNGDTYSIFAIAMAVDAYIPEVEGILTAKSINNVPVTSQPYNSLPGQEIALNVDVKNLGTEAIDNYKIIVPIPYNATYVAGSAVGTILFSPLPTPNSIYFDSTLGATGSIVWDFGKLPYQANRNTLLAKLSFKIKATLDCQILSNANCGTTIFVEGTSSGIGATTRVAFTGTKLIQGYTSNGACLGQPISEALSVGINGASYVASNCQNASLVRNFLYCDETNFITPNAIASNFPVGSLYFSTYPVTTSSIQYTETNPFPLFEGSTINYYAIPPANNECFLPFTISKCKMIVANNDTFNVVNGLTENVNLGNVFNDYGNGPDTLNGNQTSTSQITLTILNPAIPINGGLVPFINTSNGQITVPSGTPSGNYTITYKICENGNLSNCDDAVVYITMCPSSPKPILACYETATFITNTCSWNITGTKPVQPSVTCYETVGDFNTQTCAWTVTGTQPTQPSVVNCWDNFSFDNTKCAWINTGTQPIQPSVTCYETVENFNNDNCTWTVTGKQIIDKPVLADILVQCSATAVIPSTTNNCGETIIGIPQNPLTYNIEGEYTITWLFESIDKTVSVTALQKVIVKDTEAPIAPILATVKGQCSATATAPTTTDACEGTIIGKTNDDVIYNAQGTYEITWTFSDSKGNTSTAKQIVIVDETNPPTAPILAPISGSCSVKATAPSITDGCSNNVIVGTTTDELTYNEEGTFLINWTFDNGKGSVTAPQQVTVIFTNTDINGNPSYALCNDDIDLHIQDDYPTLNSLLPLGTPAGGTWIDDVNPSSIVLVDGKEKFNPYQINTGDYDLKYVTSNGACSNTVKIVMTVDDNCIVAPIGTCVIDVKNAFSPNGDALNEVFTILNIEDRTCFPTNTVEIYNRWGVLVFETNQYDNNTRVFRGISEGRATVNKSAELPTGTYFYIIQYTDDKGETFKKDGYLYLTR